MEIDVTYLIGGLSNFTLVIFKGCIVILNEIYNIY
jgi:hypothetical protein